MISKFSRRFSISGFTMPELLVVIVIAAALAAIAAPGWLSFMNSRRANMARDQVLQTLRQAQAQAVRTKLAQTVQFDRSTSPPTITAVGSTEKLGNGQLQANMVDLNFPSSNNSPTCSTGKSCTITFDENGSVVNSITGEDGIKIVVLVPPTGGAKRCVMVRTILGAMASGSGSECD